jgi:hypothetical protein
MKADERAVACLVEAARRPKDGGEQGIQLSGGLGLQALYDFQYTKNCY